jgi:hypothetical protein
LSIEREVIAVLDPVNSVSWLSDEVTAGRQKLGLEEFFHWYTVSRIAPMGAVTAGVVASVFYNFNPDVFPSIVPAAWQVATPEEVLDTERAAADDVLGPVLSGVDGLAELCELVRRATDDGSDAVGARPLAAGIAELPWAHEPHLVLWHGVRFLREYRGDCHNLALAEGGLNGIEALVVHAGMLDGIPGMENIPADGLRTSRQWPEEPWANAVERLRSDGWLTDDAKITLTESGRARRDAIEDATDALVAPAFRTIGREGLARILELGASVAEPTHAVGVQKMHNAGMPSLD